MNTDFPFSLFFIDDAEEPVWAANPPTVRGTHSPSYNSTAWGVEMVGDYETAPFNPQVKDHTVKALAVMFRFLHLSPETALRFHREDPRTSHKTCPGKNVVKDDMIRLIRAEMDRRA